MLLEGLIAKHRFNWFGKHCDPQLWVGFAGIEGLEDWKSRGHIIPIPSVNFRLFHYTAVVHHLCAKLGICCWQLDWNYLCWNFTSFKV